MEVTRRAWLAGLTATPLQAAATGAIAAGSRLPDKAEFGAAGLTYLDSGTMHPFSLGARRALAEYQGRKSLAGWGGFSTDETSRLVLGKFAQLINAQPGEVAFVPSTTAGENLVLAALGLMGGGGRIVTDTLHFQGSLYTYDQLARRGADVVTLRAKQGRIDMGQLDAAVTRGTRLVALSLVSTINGFQHDLKAVCEIAHARGARVYADIIHAAGSIPVDVKASGVDFAACAGYKWLMSDMGLGFVYARADRLAELPRPWLGYEQISGMQSHYMPFDPPGDGVADFRVRPDAVGHFAMGTIANACLVHLNYSLDYLLGVGVGAIQAHRQPLLDRLQAELPRLGFEPMTPAGSRTPLVAFARKHARTLDPKLTRARVRILTAANRIRVSPSVFNDTADIDRLLTALS
ncbi:aminotransferase class V-fold PLP-dependent enzyme [Phenylobacterium sp.]|jgi:selenocysteine lyase/cysteine desulfurase|uniref:aminotransferase class V-fold PLP-dependent enzyme n=1 Tax=Phenylobacterium sp. TaxID=1871053 RepID=UPI002F4093B6